MLEVYPSRFVRRGRPASTPRCTASVGQRDDATRSNARLASTCITCTPASPRSSSSPDGFVRAQLAASDALGCLTHPRPVGLPFKEPCDAWRAASCMRLPGAGVAAGRATIWADIQLRDLRKQRRHLQLLGMPCASTHATRRQEAVVRWHKDSYRPWELKGRRDATSSASWRRAHRTRGTLRLSRRRCVGRGGGGVVILAPARAPAGA